MEKWQRLLIVLTALLVMLILVASTVRLLMEIGHTIVLFTLGLLLAYGLDPLVEGLRGMSIGKNARRISRELSVTVVIVGFVLVLGIGFWALGGRLFHEIRDFRRNLPYYRTEVARDAAAIDRSLHRSHIDFSVTDALLGIRFHDLTIGPGNTVSSTIHPFTSAVSGHTLYISDGPGFTPGDYAIVAVDPRGNAVLSQSPGLLHSTGGNGSVLKPPADVQGFLSGISGSALPMVGHAFANMGESIIVLLVAIYFLIYSAELREKFNSGFQPDVRARIELWQTDVNRILGGFVRGQLLIAILIGSLAALGCLLLGIKMWLLIGVIAMLCALIPVFGPYIGAIPAIIAALVGGTDLHNPVVSVVLLVVYFTIVNEVGSKVLYPKLVGAALGLHPVVVLFAIFAGLEVAHVIGVLLAAPITALASVTIVHLYRWWQDLPDSLVSVPQVVAAAAGSHGNADAPAPHPGRNGDEQGSTPTHDAQHTATEQARMSRRKSPS